MRCHYCGHEGVPGDQVHVFRKPYRGDGFFHYEYKYVCDVVDNCNQRLVESKKLAILKTEKERNVKADSLPA